MKDAHVCLYLCLCLNFRLEFPLSRHLPLSIKKPENCPIALMTVLLSAPLSNCQVTDP